MSPGFNLVLLNADGSRLVRVRVPRWAVWAALALVGTIPAAGVGLSGSWALLQHQQGRIAELRQETAQQGVLIEAFRTRVAAVRGELAEWRTLHQRMWAAFGPEGGRGRTTTGVGGPAIPEPTPVGALRPAEELQSLASAVAEEGPRLRELEALVSRSGEIMSRLPLVWPVHGHVNSEFGRRQSPWDGAAEQHTGLDIGTPARTPVQAPAPGTVVMANAGGDYGRHVMLDHGNGVRSLYGHLSEIDVTPGQQVEKGQVIGRVGSTGRSTGPHLHYEIRVHGKPVDPRGFLWER